MSHRDSFLPSPATEDVKLVVAGVDRVTRAVKKGLRFLLDSQCADAAWRDFNCQPGRSEAWTTAYVASRILTAMQTGRLAQFSVDAFLSLESAARYLVETSGKDGGWGYNRSCDTDCDTTSHVALFLCEIGRPVVPRTYATIAGFQLPNGAFATYQDAREYGGWAAGHPDVTAVALQALAGVLPSDHAIMQRGVKSLRRHLATHDALSSYWWQSRHYLRRELLCLGKLIPARRLPGERHPANAFTEGCFDEALALDSDILCGLRADRIMGKLSYVESLLDSQLMDGSWPVKPILRIPLREAGSVAQAGSSVSACVPDDRRLFTTAAVIRALAASLAPAYDRVDRSG